VQVRELAVSGAFEFTPDVFADRRGLFVAPFRQNMLMAATHQPFPVAQLNHNVSSRGVVRGIHFNRTPPGSSKYSYCPLGAGIDIVVDLRVGSPTYRKWDSVLLDQDAFRAVYTPIGVGHAFVALEDTTVLSYMVSRDYVAEHELGVSVLDETLGLPVPAADTIVLSDRDRAAPTVAEAESNGLLPRFAECERIEQASRRKPA
jgi:5-epimerase